MQEGKNQQLSILTGTVYFSGSLMLCAFIPSKTGEEGLENRALKNTLHIFATERTDSGVWRSTALWCMTEKWGFLLTAHRCCLQRGQHFTHFALPTPALWISAPRHITSAEWWASCLSSFTLCVCVCVWIGRYLWYQVYRRGKATPHYIFFILTVSHN